MTDTNWTIRAREFANCNCSYGCPCQFNGLPTYGNCRAVVGIQIDTGHHGTTKLDGLKVAGIFRWPGAVHEGKGEAAIVIDERANEAQRGAEDAGKDPSTLEIICKIRCTIARSYGAAREALSHALTYYALADYYRDLLGRMGFGMEVEAMRAAWKSGGFHAARKFVTDRLFDGLPLVAATSAAEAATGGRA